eukprot:365569-Chlamydomonas_euryale.AAC.25
MSKCTPSFGQLLRRATIHHTTTAYKPVTITLRFISGRLQADTSGLRPCSSTTSPGAWVDFAATELRGQCAPPTCRHEGRRRTHAWTMIFRRT